MRLFDCFSLYDSKYERSLLDLRLHELYDVVDKFVIVEGDRTYAGKPIDSLYLKHKKEFDWANDKIIHVIVKMLPNPKTRWDNEALQRNAFAEGLTDAQPEDLVLINCVDEIPRKELLQKFKKSKDNVLTMFELDNFYYYFNGKDVGITAKFPCPVLTRYKNIEAGVHNLWDKRYSYPLTHNAGWHFSWLGGAEGIKQKLESFSHSEFDTDYFKDKRKIEYSLKNGLDLLDRDEHQYEYVDIDGTFPEYLVNNKERFKWLIK